MGMVMTRGMAGTLRSSHMGDMVMADTTRGTTAMNSGNDSGSGGATSASTTHSTGAGRKNGDEIAGIDCSASFTAHAGSVDGDQEWLSMFDEIGESPFIQFREESVS